MISIDEYARVLHDWPLPPGLVATKRWTASDTWQGGDDRNLEHQCWRIATADPDLKRLNVFHTISFDTAVGFMGRGLADEAHRADNLAKKLLVLRCLTTGLNGSGRNSAPDIYRFALVLDWILRFRIAKRLPNYGGFTIDDFHEFCSVLSSGQLIDLLPYEELLFELKKKEKALEFLSPNGIQWHELTKLLGVTSASINQSADFADALISTFPEQFTRYPNLLLQLRRGVRQSEEKSHKFEDGNNFNNRNSEETETAVAREPRRKKFQGYFDLWGYLYSLTFGHSGEDGLSFDPFGEQPRKQLELRYANVVGGRTRTLEPTDLFRILSIATTWIYQYGDHIAMAYNTFQEAHPLSRTARSALELDWERGRPDGAPKLVATMNLGSQAKPAPDMILLGEAVKYLLAAIAVLILTFGARRSIEANSVKLGCLIEDRPGLLELEMYIAKTHQDLGRRPVPEILRKAIHLLEMLSARTRRLTGDDWLFAVAQYPGSNRMVATRFDLTIDDFVNFVGLQPPEGQDQWGLTSHVFRRGFGIYYYHGFDGANLDALSLMYWHYDPRMTRIYVNMVLPGQINRLREEIKRAQNSARANRTPEMKQWIENARKDMKQLSEFAKDFDEARCEFLVSKMIDVWTQKDSVAGRGGRALFNSIQAIAAQVASAIRIGSRANNADLAVDDIRAEFRKFAATNLLEPVIGTNVFCTASPGDDKVRLEANCLNLKKRIQWPNDGASEVFDTLPDFDFALNRVCADCPFCAIFSRGREAIQRELRDEKARIPLSATPEMNETARRRYQEYRQAYAAALRSGRP